jgi:hypothetical protein
MSEGVFQQAYDRVRKRFTLDAWLALDPRQVTELIYAEMRQIDAERHGGATVGCVSEGDEA